MRSIAIGLALLLVGCVTAKPVPLPNGETGYVIEDCDGMAQCYKKAAEVLSLIHI